MNEDRYEVAVYYFPQYHAAQRNDAWHGKGWTEWETLKQGRPRFPGHRQPIVPAWDYFDEADPTWAAREIDLAAEYGITAFLYDWYWYEGRPFLQDALEQGFFNAPSREQMHFALMWANHDWNNLWPVRFTNVPERLASGRVSAEEFAELTGYIIEHYFKHPQYLLLDGAPYFSLYDLGTFLAGLGGVAQAAEVLKTFRQQVQRAGFPDVHLNGIVWGLQTLSNEVATGDPRELVEELSLSSIGSYCWVHHYEADPATFPHASYAAAAKANEQWWYEARRRFALPYFPNISMGWDSSPRTAQTDVYESRGYPWMPVFEGNSPHAFEQALRQAKAYVDALPMRHKLLTINAWNEWTEGSYLLPDTVHGTAYLEALRGVFGSHLEKKV